MLSREEKYIYEWETKRGKGKWTYILLTALVWGSMIPFLFKAFKLAAGGKLGISKIKEEILSKAFLYTWISFIMGFFFFALLMWHLAQKKYRAFKQKQKIEHEIYLNRTAASSVQQSDLG